MKSPFPGMDPYLEAHWRDIHLRMIIQAAERLQEQLPKDLRARVEERVFVESATQGFIEIREAGSGHRVITVIEILSLSNKVPGEGQDLYRQKQRELRAGGVSLVEIDLLRAGRRVLSIPPESIPPSYRTPYQVCIRRGTRPKAIEVYLVPLRERLPVIPIPLRETDPDVPLDLQAILDHCYQAGAYDDLDYLKNPDPSLDPEDAAWADALLREKRLR